jgi:hypothetical protein
MFQRSSLGLDAARAAGAAFIDLRDGLERDGEHDGARLRGGTRRRSGPDGSGNGST